MFSFLCKKKNHATLQFEEDQQVSSDVINIPILWRKEQSQMTGNCTMNLWKICKVKTVEKLLRQDIMQKISCNGFSCAILLLFLLCPIM